MVTSAFRASLRRIFPVQFTTLGRTGFKVSVIGLGTGGPSRLGLAQGHSPESMVRLVRRALDLGMNFIDLGSTYGSDTIVAEAIAGHRHEIILSAKAILGPYVGPFEGGRTASRLTARFSKEASFVTSGRVIEKRLDAILRRLGLDDIDVFSLHGVTPGQYESALRLLPTFERLKEKGKIRAIGITEDFERDPVHAMLGEAVETGRFDTIMLGVNLINRTGIPVAAAAKRHGTGVVGMYALRALANARRLEHTLGKTGSSVAALSRLLEEHGISSPEEAAMRFCRHECSVDVVLAGTGSPEHLEANAAAAMAGPLPAPVIAGISALLAR